MQSHKSSPGSHLHSALGQQTSGYSETTSDATQASATKVAAVILSLEPKNEGQKRASGLFHQNGPGEKNGPHQTR